MPSTNRLLLTYPGLHDTRLTLINAWAERTFDSSAHFAQLLRAPPAENSSDEAP